MCQDLYSFVSRLISDPTIPPDVRKQIIDAMVAQLGKSMPIPPAAMGLAPQAGGWPPAMGLAATATRKIVYVHGICRHVAGYSDSMWHALAPFVMGVYGHGILGQTRLEVLWSDLVNASMLIAMASAGLIPGAIARGGAMRGAAAAAAAELDRQRAAAEIREALRDRADQHAIHASIASGQSAGMMSMNSMAEMISIPGFNCIDDFTVYLTNDAIRQQIIDRFTSVVGPQIGNGVEIDIISHSWGTVVAYEGLRQLVDSGLSMPMIRNFFTVGAALSIGPVKMRLRPANQDGIKPANVKRWINLDARGDLIGGPLQGRPYQVDMDFVNLDPVGCGSFLGLVNPVCAHASYFVDPNVAVNRDIFARFIQLPANV